MFNLHSLPPLSLYVHIPWCVRKCPYCDFNSHQHNNDLPEHEYVAALLSDLEQELPLVWGRQVSSIFFGGGTPSLMSAQAMDDLLCGIRARLPLHPMAEITLEANPGTAEAARFRDYRNLGINRLSIGIQSFNDQALTKLGRIHNADDAKRAVEFAFNAGFDNLNLDLMFGLPEQTIDQAITDLQQAIALKPTHLSHYQLTLEPNTLFHHQPPTLPDDDDIWQMQDACHTLLAEHGYRHYEVSAFAQANRQCQHNRNYWEFGDYIGIGAGAHGKISDAQYQTITRRWKVKNPRDYLQHAGSEHALAGKQQLSPQEAAFDFMLNALRLNDGVPTALFSQHTGLPITLIEKPLKLAEDKGLIEWNIQRIAPTDLGKRFLNDLLTLFLHD